MGVAVEARGRLLPVLEGGLLVAPPPFLGWSR